MHLNLDFSYGLAMSDIHSPGNTPRPSCGTTCMLLLQPSELPLTISQQILKDSTHNYHFSLSSSQLLSASTNKVYFATCAMPALPTGLKTNPALITYSHMHACYIQLQDNWITMEPMLWPVSAEKRSCKNFKNSSVGPFHLIAFCGILQ